MGEILIGGMASLLICMFLGPKFIAWLRSQEFGQHIREEGPEGHHGKAGTPTMGGIVIFAAVAVPFLILTDYRAVSMAVFATAVATAGLGLADDLAKVRKKRSLGVSGKTKLAAQAVIAIGLWLVATEYVGLPPTLRLRFVDASVDLGLFYPVLILLVLMGATNGVNLTDGLDGLAAGLLRHRAAGLHRHVLHHRRAGAGGPGAAVGLPGRRLRGLPVVQLVPGLGVHGGHRVAGVRAAPSRRWP